MLAKLPKIIKVDPYNKQYQIPGFKVHHTEVRNTTTNNRNSKPIWRNATSNRHNHRTKSIGKPWSNNKSNQSTLLKRMLSTPGTICRRGHHEAIAVLRRLIVNLLITILNNLWILAWKPRRSCSSPIAKMCHNNYHLYHHSLGRVLAIQLDNNSMLSIVDLLIWNNNFRNISIRRVHRQGKIKSLLMRLSPINSLTCANISNIGSNNNGIYNFSKTQQWLVRITKRSSKGNIFRCRLELRQSYMPFSQHSRTTRYIKNQASNKQLINNTSDLQLRIAKSGHPSNSQRA